MKTPKFSEIIAAKNKLADEHMARAMHGLQPSQTPITVMVEQVTRLSFEAGFDEAVKFILDAEEPNR